MSFAVNLVAPDSFAETVGCDTFRIAAYATCEVWVFFSKSLILPAMMFLSSEI